MENIEAGAHVAKSATIGKNCGIGYNSVVGEKCRIGNNVCIHHNVVLYDETVVGDGTEIFDGAVVGRQPKSAGNLVHKIQGRYEPVSIGADCVIGANVVIYAGCQLENNVLVGDCAALRERCRIGAHAVLARFVSLNHDACVGSRSKIMDNTHLTAHCLVEDDVFIGVGVVTVNDNDMRLTGSEVASLGGPRICRRCRVGSGAVILPGLTLGSASLIGAGSVVTRDVPENSSVLGCPARLRHTPKGTPE